MLFSSLSSAREISLFLAVDKKISIELALGLEQMQLFVNMKTAGPDLENIQSIIKKLDQSLINIDISDALFYQKTEFYKHFLKLNPSTEISTLGKSIELAEKINLAGMKEYSPFSKWFIRGVIDDLKLTQLETNPNHKKLQILIPWLTTFINDERNRFEEHIYQFTLGYLNNLINILELYKTLNNFDTKVNSINLVHFQTKKIQIPNDSREFGDIIDSSIDQLTQPNNSKVINEKKTLPVPVDDWVFDF
jgi:hypothetical protein